MTWLRNIYLKFLKIVFTDHVKTFLIKKTKNKNKKKTAKFKVFFGLNFSIMNFKISLQMKG